MKKLFNNLPYILPALLLAGVLVYTLWLREMPREGGRITGDFEAAQEISAELGVPLFFAVGAPPT